MKMATKPKQILELRPPAEIIFEGPFEHVVTSYLELFNPSENKIGFKVKTTAPRRYCVRPNSGVVEPNCKVKIAIMLQPIEQESQAEKSKHKFMVQSTIIRENISNLDSVWTEASPEEIMDSKLRCVFQMPDVIEARVEATGTTNDSSSTNKLNEQAAINTSATPRMPTATATTTPIKQASGQTASSRSKDSSSEPVILSPTAQARVLAPQQQQRGPVSASSSSSKGGWVSSSKKAQESSYAAGDKSVASSHNLTTSFLQPMSDDYKLVFAGLISLIIGVILGKYII